MSADDADTEIILLKQTLSDTEATLKIVEDTLIVVRKELDDEKSLRNDVEKDLAEKSKELEHVNEQLRLSQALDDAEGGLDISGQSYEDKGLAVMAAQYLFSKAEHETLVGNYRTARPLLEECYIVRKEHMYGDPLTANTCYALAEIHRKSGDLSQAQNYMHEALEAQKLLFGMFAEQTAACIHAQADVHRTLGNLGEAEDMYKENMDRRREVAGDVASALHGLGALNLAKGKYKEAQESADLSYNLRMKQHKGLKHVDVLTSLILKARICNGRGDYEGGKTLAEQALANLRALTSESSPLVAEALQIIADSLFGLGEFSKAVERYESAGKMAMKYLGENHHIVPGMLIGRAKAMLMLGQFVEAYPLLEHAAAIRDALEMTKNCGRIVPAEVTAGFAGYYKSIGEYGTAIDKYKDAVKLYNIVFESCGAPTLQYQTHPIVAALLLEYGDTCRLNGMYDEGQNLLEYSKDIMSETLESRDHPMYALYTQYLGDVWLHKAIVSKNKLDFEEADKQYRRALNIRREILVENHFDLSVTLNSIAESCRVQESFDDATRMYEEALEIRTQGMGLDHWSLSEIHNNQAMLIADLSVKECQKDEWFTSDPTAPCPVFKRKGFLDAADLLQKTILRLRNKFQLKNPIDGTCQGWLEHPILINVCGNFGVVKKMESLEKSNFMNKLNKTHRKLFKEEEETASSGFFFLCCKVCVVQIL